MRRGRFHLPLSVMAKFLKPLVLIMAKPSLRSTVSGPEAELDLVDAAPSPEMRKMLPFALMLTPVLAKVRFPNPAIPMPLRPSWPLWLSVMERLPTLAMRLNPDRVRNTLLPVTSIETCRRFFCGV